MPKSGRTKGLDDDDQTALKFRGLAMPQDFYVYIFL